jgi:predicted peptidase
MRFSRIGLSVVLGFPFGCGLGVRAADLVPGAVVSVSFPELPQTFYAQDQKKEEPARMTVFLPKNYDPARKHPLLIFLNGGNGGNAGNPGVARALTGEMDFVCVTLPLFRAPGSSAPPRGATVLGPADGEFMRGPFTTMLKRLEKLVPNIDPAHRILGGFSNGAHAAAGLIDAGNGEIAARFSAFLFAEGGGKLAHYERLSGKPFLVLSSNARSRPRAGGILDAAKDAGALTTFVFEDVGRHDFPPAAYPAIRAWLVGVASYETIIDDGAQHDATSQAGR